MTSYTSKMMNDMLPPSMEECFGALEAESSSNISQTITRLENSTDDTVNGKDISHLSRLLHTHISLEYRYEVSEKTRAVKILHHLFSTKQASIIIKTKILSMMIQLLSKPYEHITFEFSWQPIWKNILDLMLREKKHEDSAGNETIVAYIFRLTEFLRIMRKVSNYHHNPLSITDIITLSSSKLSDLRTSACMQGVLILITCLPTSFASYDEMLPVWIPIWLQIEHNTMWDACWLTMLRRARKHTKTFDWLSLKEILFVKLKHMLGVNQMQEEHYSHFPRKSPAYYSFLLGSEYNDKQEAIKCISKLLYHLCMIPSFMTSSSLVLGEMVTITPISTNTDTTSSSTMIYFPGYNHTCEVHPIANDIISFIQSIRSFFYPSNTGKWTIYLGTFIRTFYDEISHHIAHIISYDIIKPSSNDHQLSSSDRLSYMISSYHAPTAKFLIGSSIGLFFESLYGKSQSLSHTILSCLKNIFAVDSSYIIIFMDFFLITLDPSSVTQSHQAIMTLQILLSSFYDMLYPHPIIISYLPRLMMLILAGLDPADQNKTILSLKFFATVFNWVPISSSYTSSIITKYHKNNHIHHHNINLSSSSNDDMIDYAHDYEVLSSFWSDWIMLFWDKIETILNSIEEKTPGNQNASHMMTNCIAECVGNFIRSISYHHHRDDHHHQDDDMMNKVEDLVISYCMKTSNYHAAKALGKIIRVFVMMRHDTYTKMISSLYDDDISSLSCSHEKLAFRFYIIAASCRNASSQMIISSSHISSILMKIISDDKIWYHSNKQVKKSCLKLIKNLCRGLSATYIRSIPLYPLSSSSVTSSSPSSVDKDKIMLGYPHHMNDDHHNMISWHEPDTSSMEMMKTLLDQTLFKAFDKIASYYPHHDTSSSSVSSSSFTKKDEEQVFMCMKIIEKVLRGSAEILYDDDHHHDDNMMHNDDDEHHHHVSSSRHIIMKKLSSSLQSYFVTLRQKVLSFLIIFASHMFNHHHILSATIYKIWMKIYRIIIINRMSVMQNIDQMKKNLDYGITQLYPSYVKKIQSYLLIDHYHTSSSISSSASYDDKMMYWYRMHMPMTYICQKVNVQYIYHQYCYGTSSFRTTLASSSSMGSLYMEGLNMMIKLSCHHYDNVRNAALSCIERISGRYGAKLNDVIIDLFNTCHTQSYHRYNLSYDAHHKDDHDDKHDDDYTYAIISGICSILRQKRIYHRIISNDVLYPMLMDWFMSGKNIVSIIHDTDKQTRIERLFYDLFLKYAKSYSLYPSSLSSSSMISSSSSPYDDIMTRSYEKLVNDNSTLSKQNLIYAYIIFHYIGYMKTSSDHMHMIIQYLYDVISSSHHQPIQTLAVNILVKLYYIISYDHYHTSSSYDNKASYSIIYENFFHGISLSHIRNNDTGNNIFIQEVMELSFQGSNLISRKMMMYPDQYEDSYHQPEPVYQKRYAIMLYQMFYHHLSSILSSSDTSSSSSSCEMICAYVEDVIVSCKKLPHTNEHELRANNAMRAEIFAALYVSHHALLTNHHTSSSSSMISLSIWKKIEMMLVDYFVESVNNISISYAYDWSQAISFIFIQQCIIYKEDDAHMISYHHQPSSSSSNRFNYHDMIIDDRKYLIELLYMNFTSSLQSNMRNELDGFAKAQKHLIFLNAMLNADIYTIEAKPSSAAASSYDIILDQSRVSVLVYMIYDEFLHMNDETSYTYLGSNYQPIRAEMGTTLGIISACITTIPALKQSYFNYHKIISKFHIPLSSSSSSSVASSSSLTSEEYKYSAEVGMIWLKTFILYSANPRAAVFQATIIPSLFKLSLESSTFINDVELSKAANMMTFFVTSSCYPLSSFDPHHSHDHDNLFHKLLHIFKEYSTHESYTIRRNVCAILIYYYSSYSSLFLAEDKTIWTNMMKSFIHDNHPKIQELSVLGMSGYFQEKSSSAMITIANTYIKNLEILIIKSKKKINYVNPQSETTHWDMIAMGVCLIRAYPYDMPSWMPAVISVIIKHIPLLQEKSIITKAIQDFKRSHQDKWSQFSASFTREQLDDLQGVGAQHYFA